ncbi:MAG: PEP-CTERM sorting domain-containing protein [Pseudomonadales bacterium]|nr:PEP-CTERM sorting domain-containing protein [Pseudomonadales bacterium]
MHPVYLVGGGSTDVPEPASIALFALGLVGFGYMRKKKFEQ